MQHYFTPEVGFSASYFEKLVKCMDYHDPILLKAQNEGWRKIREKSRYDKNRNEDKNEKDLWGNIPTTFIEQNKSEFGEATTIFEPCNYVSNVAYYHSASQTCEHNWSTSEKDVQALKRAFSGLALGSSLMHGSHTNVGKSMDNINIATISYMAYIIAVQNI